METAAEADAAITALNGTDLMGKVMAVERVCRFIVNFINICHFGV
jgi:hypothetical protein